MENEIVDTRDESVSAGDAVVQEALARWQDADTYEATNREEAEDDLNMLAGRNHWPADVVTDRERKKRPVLTINKLPSFTDQVTNDSRMNKRSIKVLPYSGGATKEVADLIAGHIRQIEDVSHADIAYQTAHDGAVNNGFGFFRIVTEYESDTSFDQVIRIKRIRNPFVVRLDPAHQEFEAEDGRYAFVEEDISVDEYEARYPGRTRPTPFPNAGDIYNIWVSEDRIKVAEYWVKRPEVKRLYLLSDNRVVDGDEWDKVSDDLQAEVVAYQEQIRSIPQGEPIPPPPPPVPTVVKERKVNTHYIEQYLLDGKQILDGPNRWAGKYIPIVPVWGKEIIINDERILRSLIRFAKDPQRMYNYFRTAAVETVALAPKAPYIADERQLEGHEEEWESANQENPSVLLYRGVPGLEAPKRQVVTQTALGEITEANISNDEMKATTSLFDASLGAQGNEVSGRAIFARQREGDVAHFIFHDNLNIAIRYAGEILVDLTPRIYDTQRQIMVKQEDGEEYPVLINQTVVDQSTGEEVILNDLSLGEYKVTVTTGPSYTTARVEAAQNMMDFARVSPEVGSMILDLIAENLDWPGAAKIMKRIDWIMKSKGINFDQPPQPPPPSTDDTIKDRKAESIFLGNEKKKLDIVEQRRSLINEQTRGTA